MTYKLSTACMDIYNAGTLKVSKNISAAFSRFLLGLSGASVSNTGCCKTQKNRNQQRLQRKGKTLLWYQSCMDLELRKMRLVTLSDSRPHRSYLIQR